MPEVQALRQQDRLGEDALPFNTVSMQDVQSLLTGKVGRGASVKVFEEALPINAATFPFAWLTQEDTSQAEVWLADSWVKDQRQQGGDPARLLGEVRAARRRLETQLEELSSRVTRAKQLEILLEQAQI